MQDTKSKNIAEADFNNLICDERVRHIIEQSEYYEFDFLRDNIRTIQNSGIYG